MNLQSTCPSFVVFSTTFVEVANVCVTIHKDPPMSLKVSYHSYKAKTNGIAQSLMYRHRCPHHYTREDSSYFSEDGFYALGLSLETLRNVKDTTRWL